MEKLKLVQERERKKFYFLGFYFYISERRKTGKPGVAGLNINSKR